MVCFNQCGMHVDFEAVDKMDTETLFMTYEALMEQEYQKWLSMQGN